MNICEELPALSKALNSKTTIRKANNPAWGNQLVAGLGSLTLHGAYFLRQACFHWHGLY